MFFEWDGADYSEFVSNSTFAAVVALNPKKVVEEHIVTADEGYGNYYCER